MEEASASVLRRALFGQEAQGVRVSGALHNTSLCHKQTDVQFDITPATACFLCLRLLLATNQSHSNAQHHDCA